MSDNNILTWSTINSGERFYINEKNSVVVRNDRKISILDRILGKNRLQNSLQLINQYLINNKRSLVCESENLQKLRSRITRIKESYSAKHSVLYRLFFGLGVNTQVGEIQKVIDDIKGKEDIVESSDDEIEVDEDAVESSDDEVESDDSEDAVESSDDEVESDDSEDAVESSDDEVEGDDSDISVIDKKFTKVVEADFSIFDKMQIPNINRLKYYLIEHIANFVILDLKTIKATIDRALEIIKKKDVHINFEILDILPQIWKKAKIESKVLQITPLLLQEFKEEELPFIKEHLNTLKYSINITNFAQVQIQQFLSFVKLLDKLNFSDNCSSLEFKIYTAIDEVSTFFLNDEKTVRDFINRLNVVCRLTEDELLGVSKDDRSLKFLKEKINEALEQVKDVLAITKIDLNDALDRVTQDELKDIVETKLPKLFDIHIDLEINMDAVGDAELALRLQRDEFYN